MRISARLLTSLMFLVVACLTSHGEAASAGSMVRSAERLAEQLRYAQAMELYRRVADSYDLSMPREQKQLCLEALLGCCDINLQQGNYQAAYENLLLAESIAERDGLPDMKVHALYGALFINMAQQTVSPAYLRKSISHDSIALPQALRARDDRLIYRTFCDLTQCHTYFGDTERLSGYVDELRRYAAGTGSYRPRVALYKYEYARAMERRDYREAAGYADSALRLLPSTLATARTRASMYKTKALAQTFGGEYAGAEQSLGQTLRLSYIHDLRDVRLAALPILADVYAGIADTVSAQKARVHMLELRDSLRSYAVAEDLHQLELKRERSDMQARMAVAEYKAREKDRWLAGISAVAVVILLFMLRLRNRNRRLREHSNLLYERMRELYRSRSEGGGSAVNGGSSPGVTAPETKYEGSTLTAADKKEIRASILRVMDSEAIYAPDLTLTGFAALVGRHPKAVSQVIHEEFDCNFSTYINRARIVEVCRRVDMPEYANLSMEAIGESVGFNSRTTFSVNFRRFTGLGIRAYRQTAQKHQNH